MSKASSIGTSITAPGWKLINQATGEVLKAGDRVQGFRGPCTITGGTPPRHEGSTGRVSTQQGDFYPSVVNAEWVKV